MKAYNKLMVTTVILVLLLLTAANLLFFQMGKRVENDYQVEINRVYEELCRQEIYKKPDLSQYRFLSEASYLPLDANMDELQEFYSTGNGYVVIKPLLLQGALSGYIRFDVLHDAKNSAFESWKVTANIALAAMGAAVLLILLFVRKTVIKPFQKISEMPYELSKGQLVPGLKQGKNRYLGKFLWGMDLLRENLEEHKRKELELQKEKKSLILSISHDIKTPLSAIKLYTRALSQNLYGQEEKKQSVIKRIDAQAEEIEGFVNDIIRTSKEDFLQLIVENGEFYLKELADGLEDYYDEKLRLIKMEFFVSSYENCLLYGDLDRAVECMQNMIENALKYGDGKKVALSFESEEDCQLIRVESFGSTLPAHELVHLFEPFWRGSNALGKSGNGLGLFICRQLLIKMDGDLYADQTGGHFCMTAVFRKP